MDHALKCAPWNLANPNHRFWWQKYRNPPPNLLLSQCLKRCPKFGKNPKLPPTNHKKRKKQQMCPTIHLDRERRKNKWHLWWKRQHPLDRRWVNLLDRKLVETKMSKTIAEGETTIEVGATEGGEAEGATMSHVIVKTILSVKTMMITLRI